MSAAERTRNQFKVPEFSGRALSFDTELQSILENGGKGSWSGSVAEKIAEKLSEKWLKQILPVLKTVVLDTKGPLKEGEIEKAKNYARVSP